jgi:hypothetical protein
MRNIIYRVNEKDASEECHDIAMSLAHFYDHYNHMPDPSLSEKIQVKENPKGADVQSNEPPSTEPT